MADAAAGAGRGAKAARRSADEGSATPGAAPPVEPSAADAVASGRSATLWGELRSLSSRLQNMVAAGPRVKRAALSRGCFTVAASIHAVAAALFLVETRKDAAGVSGAEDVESGVAAALERLLPTGVHLDAECTEAVAGSVRALMSSSEALMRRRKHSREPPPLMCLRCKRVDSPEWRRVGKGPKQYCNACGLQMAKKTKSLLGDVGNHNDEAVARVLPDLSDALGWAHRVCVIMLRAVMHLAKITFFVTQRQTLADDTMPVIGDVPATFRRAIDADDELLMLQVLAQRPGVCSIVDFVNALECSHLAVCRAMCGRAIHAGDTDLMNVSAVLHAVRCSQPSIVACLMRAAAAPGTAAAAATGSAGATNLLGTTFDEALEAAVQEGDILSTLLVLGSSAAVLGQHHRQDNSFQMNAAVVANLMRLVHEGQSPDIGFLLWDVLLAQETSMTQVYADIAQLDEGSDARALLRMAHQLVQACLMMAHTLDYDVAVLEAVNKVEKRLSEKTKAAQLPQLVKATIAQPDFATLGTALANAAARYHGSARGGV